MRNWIRDNTDVVFLSAVITIAIATVVILVSSMLWNSTQPVTYTTTTINSDCVAIEMHQGNIVERSIHCKFDAKQ